MSSTSQDSIAPCGIDCATCPILKAANDPGFAKNLAEDWRKGGQSEAKADWFKCQGCRGPDSLVWSENCKIRQCCSKEKRLQNCSVCKDFPCELITTFENDGFPHHKTAVERLRELRRTHS